MNAMLIKENNNSCNYNVKHHKYFDDLVFYLSMYQSQQQIGLC